MPKLFTKKTLSDLSENGFTPKNKAYKDIPRIKTVMFDISNDVILTKQYYILAGYSPTDGIMSTEKENPSMELLRETISEVPPNRWNSKIHKESIKDWAIPPKKTLKIGKKINNFDKNNMTLVIDTRNKLKATHKLNNNGSMEIFSDEDVMKYETAQKEMKSIGCNECCTLYYIIELNQPGCSPRTLINNCPEELIIMAGMLGFGGKIIPEAVEVLKLLQSAGFRVIPVSDCNLERFKSIMKVIGFGDPEFFFSGDPLVPKVEETCQGLYSMAPVSKTWITEVIDHLTPVLYLGSSIGDVEAMKTASLGMCVRRLDSQAIQEASDIISTEENSINASDLYCVIQLLTVGRHKAFRRRRKSFQDLRETNPAFTQRLFSTV